MTRSVSSGVSTEIQELDIRPFHLVRFGFATPVYLSGAPYDISHGGNTYLSNGHLLSVPRSISEDWAISNRTHTITTSAADQALLSVVLSTNYTGIEVEVFIGVLDDNNAVISDPESIFIGQIDTVRVSEPRGGEATISWGITSEWAAFDQVIGRRTNQNYQEAYVLAQGLNGGGTTQDYFFEYSGVPMTDLKWGSK